MMCPNCGKEVLSTMEICPNCGSNLENATVLENLERNIHTRNNRKSNKFLFIIVGILFVAVLVVLGVYFFLKSNTSSKNIFDNLITYVADEVEKVIPEKTDFVSQNYSFKADLNLNKDVLEPEYYSFINNLEFKGTAAVDYKNKTISSKMSALYNNSSLLDLNIYGSNNNVYADLGDLFSKYINIPIEKENYNQLFDLYGSSTQVADLKIVLNEFETGLKKALKDEYFKNEKETLTIDNKEVGTIKHTLILNEKNITIIARDLFSYLNNDKFLDSYDRLYSASANIQGVEEDFDIRTSIKTTIDKLNAQIEANDFIEGNDAYVSIFVDGSNSFVSLTVSYIADNDNELTLVDVTKISKGKYSFELTGEDNFKICDGKVSLTETEDTYVIHMNLDNDLLESTKLNIATTVLHGNADTYNIAVSSEDFGTVKLIFTNSYNNSAQVTLPDLSNSILYTDLTEEDSNVILEKLMQKESFNKLIEDAQSLILLFSNIMGQ